MGSQKIKVVFDANIYLSFFLTRGETIAAIFDLWQDGLFDVYASPEIVAEVHKVSFYPKLEKYFRQDDREKLSLLFDRGVKKIYPVERVSFPPDPDDAIYLEAAYACKAEYLVSGDKDLLDLQKIDKTIISSPKDFVAIIKEKENVQ